jgi:radical SAM superfamily enzyme YgiQ (UPF0313 family)
MIVLSTLNARYIHASMGLRCLRANMGALESETQIVEFIIQHPVAEIVERLLAHNPRIIGFGVYIWNAMQTEQVVAMIKRVAPEVVLVLGGPEVSYEWQDQAIVAQADHLITGAADLEFGPLCQSILSGANPEKVIAAETPDPKDLVMPYRQYTQEDIDQRVIYVEASRGCPFKCEFCLSALDKGAKPFELDRFLVEMNTLYERGTRNFKFVDRTFNLREDFSCRILDYFLDKLEQSPEEASELFLHFEVIPDRLPEKLRERLARFPAGVLQLELGIQTFNPTVQATISRRQDNARSKANLLWLRNETRAHLHVDLIAGLPGEGMHSLGDSFDQLVALDPQEIQMGILKRLRGSVIRRHTEGYGMIYDGYPPYGLLRNDQLDFVDMQRVNRFARFWDLIGNSGRFEFNGVTPEYFNRRGMDGAHQPLEGKLMGLPGASVDLIGQRHES